ncbi:MAG: tetratricopeptide repeat protein, partial [Deltaproteobacteria bacterium]|nr:tetratricopeptide repeat protein [Deltaproteobacteria bacterium]
GDGRGGDGRGGDGRGGGDRDRDLIWASGLVRAQALLQQGASDEASRLLAVLPRPPEPILAGGQALVELRTAAVAAGSKDELLSRSAERLLALPDAPAWLRHEARFQRAAALLRAGTVPARRRGRAELTRLGNETEAVAFHAAALSLLVGDLGESREARPHLHRLLVHHGETEEGRQAARMLLPSSLSDAWLRQRVRHLLDVRAYDLAEPDLQLLAHHPADRMEALLGLALIRMRQRQGYDQALAWLEEVSRGPDARRASEAWYRKGIVLGHLGRFDEAVAAMHRYLQREPRGPFAVEAGFQAGRLFHEAGRFAEAIREYQAFLSRPLRDRPKWLWFLGWSHFRAGQHAEARRIFAELVPDRNLLVGAKALYWTARSHLLEGDRRAAEQALQQLQRRAPLGYYGLLGAALQAGLQEEPVSPATGAIGDATQLSGRGSGAAALPPRLLLPRPAGMPLAPAGEADLREVERQLGDRKLRAALRCVRLLAAVGLLPLARHEAKLGRLEQRLAASLGPKNGPPAVDRLRVVLEQFGERWKETARHRLPWVEDFAEVDRQTLRRTYPAALLPLAEAAGRLQGVSPWWLLAHMLQESRFQAASVSSVGALGPMQVMPATGRRIAAIVGFPRGAFSDRELYEPGVALRHAGWYLATLRDEYSGWTLLAMAGYNGGPLLLGQHLSRRPDMPGDVLIEEIGPHEMRNYVRKVADHLVRYLTLYASDAARERLLGELLPPAPVQPPRRLLDF